MAIEYRKNGYLISDDKKKLKTIVVHSFLSSSYWAKGITFDQVKRSIKHSLCFGLYYFDEQIGFARVVTDYTTFAYACDLFVLEKHRNKGLGKFLMESMLQYPDLQDIRKWMLTTDDTHNLYEKFDFVKLTSPEKYMEMKSN